MRHFGSVWYPVLASTLLVFGSVSAAGGKDTGKSATNTPWKVTGELEESCSCDGACPCWFGNKPTKMNCSGAAAVFIKKGSYGNVPLDGLALAEWVQSPDGKSMMESVGHWNFSNVYIDEKANPEQRKALEAIASQVLPPSASGKRTFRYAPITRSVEGKEHVVAVGTYGSFSGHLLEGGFGGPPKVVNPLLPDPMHKEYSQGVTSRHTYDDAAKWEFSNSNYMWNQFTVTNKDYEEMAAKMAAKMGTEEKK